MAEDKNIAIADEADLERQIMLIKDNDKLLAFLKSLGRKVIEAQRVIDETNKERQAVQEMLKAQAALLQDIKTAYTPKFDMRDAKEENLYKLGKFLQAAYKGDVRSIVELGGASFGRDHDWVNAWPTNKDIRSSQERVKADLGTPIYSDATTGSYTLAVQYIAEINKLALQASQLMSKVRRIPMSGITAYVPQKLAGPSFTWRSAQTSAYTESAPTFTRATLTAYSGGLWFGYTEEFDEDALVNIGAYFAEIIGEAWGQEFDTCVMKKNSSGSDLWNGVLYAGTAVHTMGAGDTGFANLDFDDLGDVIGQLDTEAKRQGAMWVWHPTIFDYLRDLRDDNGQYYLNPYLDQGPTNVKGYPHIECDAMPSASDSAVSTPFVALFNPKHVAWGDRVGMSISMYPNTSYMAEYGEKLLRARVRAAFTVLQAGACGVIKTAAV